MIRFFIVHALVSLLALPALAGTAARRFRIGAVVVRSARLSAGVTAMSNGSISIQQIANRGTPPPMLLVSSHLMALPESGMLEIPPDATGPMAITVVY